MEAFFEQLEPFLRALDTATKLHQLDRRRRRRLDPTAAQREPAEVIDLSVRFKGSVILARRAVKKHGHEAFFPRVKIDLHLSDAQNPRKLANDPLGISAVDQTFFIFEYRNPHRFSFLQNRLALRRGTQFPFFAFFGTKTYKIRYLKIFLFLK